MCVNASLFNYLQQLPCNIIIRPTITVCISTKYCFFIYMLDIFSFIHSFNHFYSASSSPLLLRGAPDTALMLCRNFIPKHHRQLWVKDLPKVPTWWLEQESNPRPFGRKVSTLPMCYIYPTLFLLFIVCVYFNLLLQGFYLRYIHALCYLSSLYVSNLFLFLVEIYTWYI